MLQMYICKKVVGNLKSYNNFVIIVTKENGTLLLTNKTKQSSILLMNCIISITIPYFYFLVGHVKIGYNYKLITLFTDHFNSGLYSSGDKYWGVYKSIIFNRRKQNFRNEWFLEPHCGAFHIGWYLQHYLLFHLYNLLKSTKYILNLFNCCNQFGNAFWTT